MAFTHPEYLVATEWLEDHLGDPSVRVLDVTAMLTSKLENRAKDEWYDKGHIPGSVFFDVSSAKGTLSDPDAALPWMWPQPAQFAATMADIGVGPDSRVVLVARTPRSGIDSGTMWCTRAWWTMHHFGVDCAILLGGLEKWQAEGRPMTTEPSTVPEVEPIVVDAQWPSARATSDDVLAALDGPTCLIDALPASSFDGSGTKYGPRGGHITGAMNLPYLSLIEAETAAFVDADEMERRLTEGGLLGAG
jgi:thiosulfate/3-mercaptopyruvate sulfurtransferase